MEAIVDPNGHETDYVYNAANGEIATETKAADANGVQPQTRYTYGLITPMVMNVSGQLVGSTPVYRLTRSSSCVSAVSSNSASCVGTAAEQVTTYAYANNNALMTSKTVAAGDGSLSITESYGYDSVGNRVSVTKPMGSGNTPTTTTAIYDVRRHKIGEIGPAPTGDGHYRATRTTYDLDGRVTLDETGYTTSPTDTNLSTFVSLEQVATVYDSNNGHKIQDSHSGPGVISTLTQYGYDPLDRLLCTALRMNASAFSGLMATSGALPTSACSLGLTGSDGPDRITHNTYDAAGELLQVTTGYGTSAPRNDKTLTYTADSKVQTEADGDGNLTTHVYDGLDRLSRTFYPNPSNGASSSTTDYEQYGYDAASNMVTDRRRDGNTLSMTYDALNREVTKAGPGIPSIFVSYDLLGRKTNIAYTSSTGPGNAYSYDALGRVTTASSYSWPMAFQYDLAGDRTAITWWDGVAATYSYDTDGEMTSIAPHAPNAPVGVLASYSYDDLGRRTGIGRGNGVSTAYGYDGVSRLASLTHTLVGGNVQSQAYGLGYTASSQINSLSQSNGAYVWAASYGPSSFDDEFSSLLLWNGSTGAGSTGVWATNYGFGGVTNSVAARTLPGTGEVELYVDPSMTGTGTTALGLNPYSLSDGVLTLHAGPTPTADVSSIWGYKFTSGVISSRSTYTQTYGYFEAEMKLPPGAGNWPAFWLYAVNANSELDVMEEQNGSNLIIGTAHNNGAGGAATFVTNSIPNLTSGFHKFGVLWTPTTITWYVDRVAIGSVPTPSNLNSPMYMIANLALNSGTPSTYAGGDLQIGYIRAYTLANSPVSNQSLTYSVNGQNQLTSSGGAAISYDARGNLNADSVNTYSYDLLNRLVTTGAGVTTVYDPEDRLLSLTQGATTTTQFAYVGPNVATEFNASNQILRRYVPGPAEDEPVVWFEGSDGANPRWLLQDHQGSVVAVTDMTGGALAINTYSDYGAPGSGNLGRYQFTGQVYLPEVGVYDYKARLYSPTQARFMQTDPVGYKDGLNWYDYVHGDPVNGTDPSGNDSYLIFRSVAVIGNHGFIVVTNKDGSVRARFSYGPQSNNSSHPGQLVEEQGNPGSFTTKGDGAAFSSGKDVTEVVNLNSRGFTDNGIVTAGQKVDSILGTPSNPGPTKYNFWPDGKNGDANSDSGSARVLDTAKPGSSSTIPLPLGVTPGWKNADKVGTSPPPPPPPIPPTSPY